MDSKIDTVEQRAGPPQLATGTRLRIVFKRIGRTHEVPDLEVTWSGSADAIAEDVYRFARHYLASKEVEVVVAIDLDTGVGTVSIGWGRFGEGTIAVLP